MSTVLGVDIGGSHITAALVDLTKKELLPGTLVRQPVDAHAGAAEIIKVWSKAMEEAFLTQADLSRKVGVAMPGPFEYETGISRIRDLHKYDALYGMNVKELLATQLHIPPESIRLMNDAGCFLRGEVFGGAAGGFSRAIGLTLGTGLGTATYTDGIAQDAALWQTPFRKGKAEDYISSRWFVQRYQALTGEQLQGVKEIRERYPQDPFAQQLFAEFAGNLAEFLDFFIRKENPEVVVLGGNIARAYELFADELQARLQVKSIPIRIALLGEEAALIGAASCWEESGTEQ